MKLFLAMLSHETNTFSNVPTNRAPVRGAQPPLRRRDPRDLPRHRHLPGRHDRRRRTPRRAPGALGGGGSLPAGPVTKRHLRPREGAHAGRPAGGGPPRRRAPGSPRRHGRRGPWTTARATSSRRCAQVVGPPVPIAVTLDFHGNLSEEMVRGAELLHGYKTYPHVDMAERGMEATARLLEVIAGRIRPTAAPAHAAAAAAPGQSGHRARAHAAPLRSGRGDGEGSQSDLGVRLRGLPACGHPRRPGSASTW